MTTKIAVIDFETYYDKDYSLSKITTEEYIRDPRFQIIGFGIRYPLRRDDEYTDPEFSPNTTWFSASSKQEYVSALEHLRDYHVISHNAMFDMGILSMYLGIKPLFIFDTLSMARPHHGLTVGGSLKALAEYYNLPAKGTEVVNALGKRLEQFTPRQLGDYAEYCKHDVDLCWAIFTELKPNTPNIELRLIDKTIRMFSEPVLELDEMLLRQHLDEVLERKRLLMDTIPHNRDYLMSNPKFAGLLRNLGVDPPMKISKTTGKETFAFSKTDQGFTDLMNHSDDRVQALVAARLGVKSTLEETRSQRMLEIVPRGQLPIPLSYYGAVTTGRWSGTGAVNFQNMPRGGNLRRAIHAPKGHLLVACDSSNIELRVNHTLAGQKESVAALKAGRDLYCEFAGVLYGREITKANKAERQMGKLCHLGLGYGMGAAKFMDTCRMFKVDITAQEAERTVGIWRDTYYMIPQLWAQCGRALTYITAGRAEWIGMGELVRTGVRGLDTAPDNHISYPGLRKSDGSSWVYTSRKGRGTVETHLYGGKVCENIVQHLARNIVAGQWVKIASRYKVVLQAHDELVCCVPEAEAEDCLDYMVRCMSTAPTWWPDITLAAEGNVGYTYADAK